MSKKDLFVVIYTCIWASIIVIFCTVTVLNHLLTPTDCTIICNAAFLSITASFVFIKPIRRWVNKNIIKKLP